MADELETPKVLEELSKSNSAPSRKRSTRQKRTALKRAAIFLLLLTPLLLGVLVLGYQQWNLGGEVNRLATENARLSADLGNADVRIREMELTLSEQAAEPAIDEAVIDQLRRDFIAETDRLNALLSGLQNRITSGQSSDDGRWHLVEAEQLVRIANQQLQLTGNVTVAIAILESADRVLADSGDANVFSLRQSLGSNLTALRRVNVVDTEGLYIRLNNLKESVAQLSLNESAQDMYRQRLSDQTQLEPVPDQSTDSFLDSGFAFLNSVFVWRKWEDSPNLVYQPQQGEEIKRNVNLMLEQAQLALMLRQHDVFRESLTRSRVWMEQYLAEMATGTQPLIAELESFLAIELNPSLPDISQTVEQIRQINLGRESEPQ